MRGYDDPSPALWRGWKICILCAGIGSILDLVNFRGSYGIDYHMGALLRSSNHACSVCWVESLRFCVFHFDFMLGCSI